MSLKNKLIKIENELDTMDTSDPRYEILSAEADDLAEQITSAEEAMNARFAAVEAAKQAKIADIRRLDSLGKIDEMIDKYGDEFINDYHVEGDTITSSVAREDQNSQWTVKDVNAKLRQLLYYRIYDHYVRD